MTAQDAGRLTKGARHRQKTAERLLLELRGKLGADLGAPVSVGNAAQADILQSPHRPGLQREGRGLGLKELAG